MNKPIVIAVCGKGGVGKTSVSALMTKFLVRNQTKKILAIDADPAVGLSYALGIEPVRTVDDIRSDLIHRIEAGEKNGKRELLARLDYEMFEALEERENLAFLAIGRPEQEGCYCRVNHLLKDIIDQIARNFDYVVIDGEAGIEQINRRVMELVTHLLLVTDVSAKGRNVADTIENVAQKTMNIDRAGLLFNRVRSDKEARSLLQHTRLPVIGWLPEDETVRIFDIEGQSFFEMPDCDAFQALENVVSLFCKMP